MTIDEVKPKRQNRTLTLHLGNSLAEYEARYLSQYSWPHCQDHEP
jgi:hypothetical protein